VLAALLIDTHVHHRQCRAWFNSDSDPFATCAITQGTLLRVHMTMAADGSATAAWATLAAIEAHPRHVFWEDGFSYRLVPHQHLQGPKQVTDAWLATLARRHNGKLLTLDSALVTVHRDVAVLVPR
jgi:predicted nucleic acid-binding protein